MTESSERKQIDPRTLTRWSNILAWPGVAILLFVTPKVSGPMPTALVIGGSVAMILTGAVLGQIGKERSKRQKQ